MTEPNAAAREAAQHHSVCYEQEFHRLQDRVAALTKALRAMAPDVSRARS